MMQTSDSPKAAYTSAQPKEWYKRSFGRSYLNLYARRDGEEAKRQIDFLLALDRLTAQPINRALDIACGAGRHSWALSERVGDTVGIDLSPELLAEAVAERNDSEHPPQFIRADMRTLPFTDASFDLLLSMFTSFGYFESDRAHELLLKEWYRVLKRGGTLALDYLNRDYLLASLIPESIEIRAGQRIMQRRSLSADGLRVEKAIRLLDVASGEIEEFTESVRVYSAEQVSILLEQSGFRLHDTYGSWSGEPFSPQSERLILIATA